MRLKITLLIGVIGLLLASVPAFAQPPGGGGGRRGGGPGGGGPGGGGGGRFFGGDPNQMFDRLSGGKDVWTRADSDERQQFFFDRVAQGIGVTNGQITREQFVNYMEQQGGQFRGRGGRGAPPPSAAPERPGGGPSGDGRALDPDATSNWAENAFRRLDANGDGYLNHDEMPEALRS